MRAVHRLGVVAAAGAVVLVAGAGAASAHVHAEGDDLSPGGYGVISFRVPDESDTASTTSVRVQVPAETPLASVSTLPVPGWTVQVEQGPLAEPVQIGDQQVTDAVSTITWTADAGGGIAPGQYQVFSISAGPLPEVDSITFPTIQTYSDGEEVSWIEPTVDGQAEPEHPAPAVTLAAEDGADPSDGAAASDDRSGSTPTAEASADGTSGTEITALVLSVVALVAGLAALGVALAGRRRSAV